MGDRLPGRTRIAIVDDHPVLRRGLRSLLEGEGDFEVCGEAGTLSEGLDMIGRLEPDLAIVDIALGSSDGLDLVKSLRSRWPAVRVLVVSMMSERLYAELALSAGARGYVMKGEPPETVLTAVRRILSGDVYLSEDMRDRWPEASESVPPSGELPIGRLTPRELATLRFFGMGKTAKEIARDMHLSVKTVETHRDNLRNKLGLASSSEVLQYAALWLEHAAAGEVGGGED